jgi:hypothetical protein
MYKTAEVNRFGCGVGIHIEERPGSWEALDPIIWPFPDRYFDYSTRSNWTYVKYKLNSAGKRYSSKFEGIIL